MKITQQVTREGDDLVLRLHEQPSGKLLATRVWEGAGKYLRPMQTRGYLSVQVPEKSMLSIKPKGEA